MLQVFAFGFPTFALPFVYSGAKTELGWTNQEAVLLTSFKFYTSAVAALFVGRLLDILNPKYVITAAALIGALSMIGFMAKMADQSGNYSGAFALGTIAALIAAILLFPVKSPTPAGSGTTRPDLHRRSG